MKNSMALAVLLLCSLGLFTAHAQITPLGDAYTSSTDPTTNYGAATTLAVDGAKEASYIQFNLSSIPTGASVSQATLKLYVNSVTTAGSFEVYAVNGTWTESGLTYNLAPALGSVIDSSVPITAADKNQYILIPMTSTVQGWVNLPASNNGIALVAVGSFNATFDSKESTTTSHAAELDIVFAGDGTITGVTTASGSGLTGGGTSGTLNLSLTDACAANQVLQWNGSAWICASAGTGTITGVTAGTDLTGGGKSGNVTLNVNTTALNSVYAQLAASNTFTGNQTVNGTLSATGVVTGSSYDIGSNAFAFGSYANGSVYLGFAGNSATTAPGNTAIGQGALLADASGTYNTATGQGALRNDNSGANNTADGQGALYSNTTGNENTATGGATLYMNTTGTANTATGISTLYENSSGSENTATGNAALFLNSTGSENTATGSDALSGNTTGSFNTASGYQAGETVDSSRVTGSGNTFVGSNALLSTGTLTNATAIGANADVAESNALVLGSINGTNGATATVNIGIGTTTPAERLDVGLGDAIVRGVSNFSSAGQVANLFVGDNAHEVQAVNAGGIGLSAYQNPDGLFVTDNEKLGSGCSQGFVGIQVTCPTNSLTIAKGFGAAIADGWTTYSSRRWKTNIRTLQGALAKVEQLRGVSYDLKESGKHEVGVIAEEVGAVVPEVVSYEENGRDARGVDYSRLTALLIEAIKQQQRELRDLKSELRTTRLSLQKVRAQVAASQATVVAAK